MDKSLLKTLLKILQRSQTVSHLVCVFLLFYQREQVLSRSDGHFLQRRQSTGAVVCVCSTGHGLRFGQLRASGLSVRLALKVISAA